jgi:hypothetical protein
MLESFFVMIGVLFLGHFQVLEPVVAIDRRRYEMMGWKEKLESWSEQLEASVT